MIWSLKVHFYNSTQQQKHKMLNELILHLIIEFIDSSELFCISELNKHFRTIVAGSTDLWNTIYRRRFPDNCRPGSKYNMWDFGFTRRLILYRNYYAPVFQINGTLFGAWLFSKDGFYQRASSASTYYLLTSDIEDRQNEFIEEEGYCTE